jgi:hypothetical protein
MKESTGCTYGGELDQSGQPMVLDDQPLRHGMRSQAEKIERLVLLKMLVSRSISAPCPALWLPARTVPCFLIYEEG